MQTARCVLALAALSAASAHAEPPPEPAVRRTVIEDDGARIEELRVRGEVRRIVVQPKLAGASAYEIVVREPARDMTPERRSSGQRVWPVWSF